MESLSLQGKIYVLCQGIYFVILVYGIILVKKIIKKLEGK